MFFFFFMGYIRDLGGSGNFAEAFFMICSGITEKIEPRRGVAPWPGDERKAEREKITLGKAAAGSGIAGVVMALVMALVSAEVAWVLRFFG